MSRQNNSGTRRQAARRVNSGSRYLTILGVFALVAGILGIPAILDWQTRRIISVYFVDVSKSAQEYPFSDESLSYPSLVEQHCGDRIELLKENDVLINGKFASEATVTRNTTFYNDRKGLFLKECQHAATIPHRMPDRDGTSLPLALERIRTSIASLRTQGNSNPVAIALIVHAAEPGPQQPQLDWDQLQATIREMVADRAVLVVIGPDTTLQKQLSETLADVPATRVCAFADRADCTEWAVETARQLHKSST